MPTIPLDKWIEFVNAGPPAVHLWFARDSVWQWRSKNRTVELIERGQLALLLAFRPQSFTEPPRVPLGAKDKDIPRPDWRYHYYQPTPEEASFASRDIKQFLESGIFPNRSPAP